jgi:acetyl esterase/lipase
MASLGTLIKKEVPIAMDYQDLLQTLRLHSPSPNASLAEVREDFEAFYSRFQAAAEAIVEASPLNNALPAFWIQHRDIGPHQCMLFFHGGGFTIGSTRDHTSLCTRLSQAAETRVFSVDYRLAPEHRFPAALDDALTAYRALLAQYDPGDIIVAGISAGGGLALSLLLAMKEQAIPQPPPPSLCRQRWICSLRANR